MTFSRILMTFLCSLEVSIHFLEVNCDHPTSAKDGFIEVSNFRGNYVFGSRAKYHCNPGAKRRYLMLRTKFIYFL